MNLSWCEKKCTFDVKLINMNTLKTFLLSALLFLVIPHSFGQSEKCMSFKDKESGLWGFKNSETKEIVIPALYETVACYKGEIFPVKKDGFWYMVNAKNEPLTPTNKMKDVMMYHSLHGSEPIWWGKSTYANELIKDFGYFEEEVYKINKNCDCVPEDYYLCPFYVDMDTTLTPEYLKMMQIAHVKLTEHFDLSLAQYYYSLAKKMAPNNPFVDYYMGNVYFNTYRLFNLNEFGKLDYEKMDDWYFEMINSDSVSTMDKRIVQCFYNGVANEMNEQLQYTLDDYYWNFYDGVDTAYYFKTAFENQQKIDTISRAYWELRVSKYSVDEISSKKEMNKEFKILQKSPYKKEMSPDREDLTLTIGGFMQNGIQGFSIATQIMYRPMYPPLFEAHYGLGYERYLKQEYHVNAYNLDLYVLNLGLFSGNKQRSFGIRPTIPIGIWYFQLEYGYQFILGPNNNDLRGHRFGLKFNIPYYNLSKNVSSFHFFGDEFYN